MLSNKSRSLVCGILIAATPGFAQGAPSQDKATRPRTTAPDKVVSSPQKGVSAEHPPKTSASRQTSVADLIEQGKVLYRKARFPQALAKFEAALKIEPVHDEALGLAAITAFRVDNQEQSREWFIRRAELPDQKPSVRAFSYYRVALSHWRRVHDPVAKSYSIKDGRISFKITDADAALVRENLSAGLDYADRALRVNANYSEAHNIRNLLYSEAALATSNEDEARRNRALAVEALKKAIKLQLKSVNSVDPEAANFNLPTVRIGEIPRNADEEGKFNDAMLSSLQGGQPVKRVSPVFPSTRPAKKDDSQTGSTDKSGAYSIGSGRGALTAAYAPGTVKVEVLMSTTGAVVFAHVVSGRADLNGAAILAARGWKFSPARFDDVPVQLSGVITFDMKPGGSRTTPSPTPTPRPPTSPR
ncbi:MAG: energy transducer TonB [Acidobacteriota bacterium]